MQSSAQSHSNKRFKYKELRSEPRYNIEKFDGQVILPSEQRRIVVEPLDVSATGISFNAGELFQLDEEFVVIVQQRAVRVRVVRCEAVPEREGWYRYGMRCKDTRVQLDELIQHKPTGT